MLSQLFYSILLELPVNIIRNYSVYLSCFSFHNVLDDYLNSNFLFLFLDYCLSFYFHFNNYIFPFLQFLFFLIFWSCFIDAIFFSVTLSIKNSLILLFSEHCAIFKPTWWIHLFVVGLLALFCDFGLLSVHCNFILRFHVSYKFFFFYTHSTSQEWLQLCHTSATS